LAGAGSVIERTPEAGADGLVGAAGELAVETDDADGTDVFADGADAATGASKDAEESAGAAS
jgi:hypothetical protein